ncbi:protein pbn1 [Aspergillus ellipticus CBS 707.79]|uniref:Protein PBN1 n=1 Tax=Aspergillus ellipticus CBS 707.79 TaxID=1448320 RepID=A0A319DN37_9EURO|nr:protein pbn1 [Aspergillus ellipticus CBS 707.79]
MKIRITYLQPPSSPFSASQASLSASGLRIQDLDAAREERVTLDVADVPDEARNVLGEFQEIHLRWAREEEYGTVQPWGSRVGAGLHAGVSLRGGDERYDTISPLCHILKTAFSEGIDCVNLRKSFTPAPTHLTTSSSPATTHNYYAPLPTHRLAEYIAEKICPAEDKACRDRAATLQSADSIDIDYDAESQTLVVSAYWGSAVTDGGWTEEISAPTRSRDRVEVGLLGTETATEAGEIKVGGLLGVVGVDTELKPTLFSFPSKHHVLPSQASFSVDFPPPTGMHPTMSIALSSAALENPPAPPYAECALHAYLSLPSYLFIDKFQLMTGDRLFLDSHHLAGLRAVAGATDLEAPDWVVSQWGSNVLLELATPEPNQLPEEWNVTVPLHLRYMRPSESGYRSVDVPWPVVFWACAAEDTKMSLNPFDRAHLGWDGLFGPQTMFYQVNPTGARQVEKFNVPVLRLEEDGSFNTKTIEWGTVAVIVLGFLWVLWKLGSGARAGRQQKEKKSQ